MDSKVLADNKLGQRVAWISLATNIILFILKLWAGIVSSSVALTADAWHTLSDSISSLIVLFGLRLAARPADREHPFGHGRAELVASVILGVILAVIAFNFLFESIAKFRSQASSNFGAVAIIAMVVSILVKEAIARYSIRIGKKTNSNSLKADGQHHRSDALSSLVILGGIFLGRYFWWIDSLLGVIVSIFIFYTSYEILKQTISALLGEKPDSETIRRIKLVADKSSSYEVFLHDIKLHEYGYHKEMTCHIRLPGYMKLSEAHEIATAIEKNLKQELNISTDIHIDPLEYNNKAKTVIPGKSKA